QVHEGGEQRAPDAPPAGPGRDQQVADVQDRGEVDRPDLVRTRDEQAGQVTGRVVDGDEQGPAVLGQYLGGRLVQVLHAVVQHGPATELARGRVDGAGERDERWDIGDVGGTDPNVHTRHGSAPNDGREFLIALATASHPRTAVDPCTRQGCCLAGTCCQPYA